MTGIQLDETEVTTTRKETHFNIADRKYRQVHGTNNRVLRDIKPRKAITGITEKT